MSLSRNNLPIKLNDEAWAIFEGINKIYPLSIRLDPTYKNGIISENVKARFDYIFDESKMEISFHDENITEQTIIHELLHAKRLVEGFPFLYHGKSRVSLIIYNLVSSIEHLFIFDNLERRGFTPRPGAIKSFRERHDIINKEFKKRNPQDILKYPLELELDGASTTIDGLISGLKLDEIKKTIHPLFKIGINKGVKIYNELINLNFSDKEEMFKAYMKTAITLNLTTPDVTIIIMDFENNIRNDYDPITGNLFGSEPIK